jgi:hypothetical protein
MAIGHSARPSNAEYEVRLESVDRGLESAFTRMRTAREGKDPHAGVLRRQYPGRTVLDDQAANRAGAHLVRSMQEKVRERLASLHHGRTIDMRLEQFQQAGDFERQTDSFRLAR